MESDKKKFIILARYRSGSNLLHESLRMAKEIKGLYEYFNISHIADNPQHYSDKELVNKLFSNNDESITTIGFKLMYGQATHYELNEANWGPNISLLIKNQIRQINSWLASNNLSQDFFENIIHQIQIDKTIKIIHLIRKNQLESFVSLQLAMRENNWVGAIYQTLNSGIYINIKELEKYFNDGEYFHNCYLDLFKEHEMLETSYDELSDNFSGTLQSVLHFLEIKNEYHFEPPLKKQSSGKPSEIILNYDDLCEYFMKTKWHNYFTAD